MSWLRSALVACAAVLLLPEAIAAQPQMGAAAIDRLVSRSITAFAVPGVSVGVVKDGRLVFAKGYGVRTLGKAGAVDPDTLFEIGSNTKAFTAAALAILVDEHKIGWDDRVVDYLPEFRMYDPYVTHEFTVRDLLTHRSGLGTGAGDLMFLPSTDFTRSEVIRALRYLKPVASFRSQFNYDNLLYMVAGELVPAVTGMSWEKFVQSRIMTPLRMEPCGANSASVQDQPNLAMPHVPVEGTVRAVPLENLELVGPAGSIECNISGLAKWVQTQLAQGESPSGTRLFSAAQGQEMWTPQTLLPTDAGGLEARLGIHFPAYALGWSVGEIHGHKIVHHDGDVTGMSSMITLVPDLNLGIIVLANREEPFTKAAISLQILERYLGGRQQDWVGVMQKIEHEQQEAALHAQERVKTTVSAGAVNPTLPLEAYAGEYHDDWRGDATVRMTDGRLVLKFSRTTGLEGSLEPFSGNIFVVRWNDRSLDADAYVRFLQDYGHGVQGMTMQAVSPSTDFSYDFQDLNFKKIR